ncbi:unnamed protein product, partial [Iphiclides podalirius]
MPRRAVQAQKPSETRRRLPSKYFVPRPLQRILKIHSSRGEQKNEISDSHSNTAAAESGGARWSSNLPARSWWRRHPFDRK